MKDCRRRTIHVLVMFAVLLATAPAFAEDSDLTRRERLLRSKLILVFLFEEEMPALAEKGNGVRKLDVEIRGVRDQHRDAAGLLDLFSEMQLRWAKLELARGDVDQAILHFEEVLNAAPPDAAAFLDAASTAARIYRDQGERLEAEGNDDAALERYGRAEELFRRGRDEASAVAVGQKSADLEAKEGLRAFDVKDYDKAFQKLSSLKERSRPGFAGSQGDQKLTWMIENTGVLTIRTLPVSDLVPGQSVEGLDIRLKRIRNGDDVTRPFAESFRWQTGDYDLQPLLAGGNVVLTVRVNLVAAGGVAEIPSKVPDGMAFIPRGGAVTRGFFIDRTEVTQGEFRKHFPSRTFASSQANYPAHGIVFEEAQRYASKVGKELPTYEQWQRAAFGDSNPRFPWGSDDSLARACNVGNPEPMAVGSFKGSLSKDYGLADMAGNVWEWLQDEHAIGGGFLDKSLNSPYELKEWGRRIDFLRDKRPSKRIFDSYTDPAQRKKYEQYYIRNDILGEVGFRCVLELRR